MTTFNNTDFPQVSHADWETNFESKKTTTSQLPYQEFTGILKQSPGDKRKYRLIRLPNNLVALCAHDADAEQAAVSLCVHVGSNGDSPELQGMAHFLEHMLFMGSKKYPAEDAYFKYMSNHSGYANAGTYFEKTDYHFKVDNGALEGALDMLSQVLTQPALNANAVDREINAVNSEFVNSIINDYWRTEQMTAIKMALENVRSPAPYTVQNGRNYENIGMYKTFDGRWMVTDIDKFKATQQLYGQPIPVHNMIPKY
ncbi:metalloprotease [Coemansia sp. Benny D115]|nr:metalloprotease [Coemansia sp. Benny D115]